jgi:prolyl oligopeptidase PreP (S9A serine peptidase family)
LSRNWLVLTGHDDLRPWLRVLDRRAPEGELIEVPLPEGASTVAVFWHAVEPDSESGRDMRLNIMAQGQLLPPSLYRLDLDTMSDPPQPEFIAQAKPTFDASGMEMRLLEAASDAGTQVPYHVALPREAAHGPVPVVVTAYGGYGIPVPAYYLKFEGPRSSRKASAMPWPTSAGAASSGPHGTAPPWDLTGLAPSRTAWRWPGT